MSDKQSKISIDNISIVMVNYNTPLVTITAIDSILKFYPAITLHLVDGSDNYTKNVLKKKYLPYPNVIVYNLGYNINHGPGIDYGIKQTKTPYVLVLDSDIEVLKGNFIEDLCGKLQDEDYGVGDIQIVNEAGIATQENNQSVKYLHPACMLLNKSVYLQYAPAVNHGAPMIEAMIDLKNKTQSSLIRHIDWVENDFRNRDKIFIDHKWGSTSQHNSKRGYLKRVVRKMKEYITLKKKALI